MKLEIHSLGLAIAAGLVWAGFASRTQAANVSARPGLMEQEFIFTSAPFPSCHASTIVETKSGLVAAWFGGTRERHPDVGIWLSRHERGQWTAPQEVANGVQPDGGRQPSWNPVLFQPKNGPLLLFYKIGPSPSTWWGMVRKSADNGRNWGEAIRLPNGMLGPIKNKPIQLPDGDILCPSSSEDHGWRVHFERATPDLAHWKLIGPVNDGKEFGAIQPSLLSHPGGVLEAVGRTKQGKIFQIWSEDGGNSWKKMSALPLPNPNSGLDAVTLADGRHLLVYNHTRTGRSPLNVAVSSDGKIWQAALTLENEPGEFSYPAVIQASDHLVHVTYTWNRKLIKHVVLDPARLELKPFQAGRWPE